MAINEKTTAELQLMKNDMLNKHQTAVTAAHQYACALPIGNERTQAFEIYQNMLYATRIG